MEKGFKIIYGFIILMLFTACNQEEVLTPSLKDVDRVAEFVNASDNQYVEDIYQKYNCGLMYEFDPILDFAYTAQNYIAAAKWGNVEFTQIRDRFLNQTGNMIPDSLLKYNAYVSRSLTFLDTTLFSYLADTGLVIRKLPHKILLADLIYSVNPISGNIFTESDNRIGSEAINTLNCLFNDNSIVFNVNQDALKGNASKFRKDNFYILVSRIVEMYDLYSLIPDSFYNLSSVYYGKSISAVYASDFDIDLANKANDAPQVPAVVDKSWFYTKGFVDARYFYNRPSGLTTIDGESKAIRTIYTFVEDGHADFRSYLNEAIHRNASELAAYPEEVKFKFRILVNALDNWGVKIKTLNPALNVLFEN